MTLLGLAEESVGRLLPGLYGAFVTDYFLSGAIFSGLVLGVLLLARRFAGPPRPSEPPRPIATRRRLAAVWWGVIAFAVVFLSRVAILDRIVDPSFLFSDEQLDSCIGPLQAKLQLPIWGGNSNYLHYTFSRFVLDTIGFHPTVLRAFQAFRFALGVGVFVALLVRPLGHWVVLTVAGLLAVSYPYLWHSIWSTALGSGGLPALVFFALLLGCERITKSTAVVMGAILGASLYVYPGATLAIGCALVLHVLWYRERWDLGRIGCAAVSALATKGLLDALYHVPFLSARYGGGAFSVRHLIEAWTVTPSDFFYRSTSWATLNFGGPYFEPVMLWTLVLAFVARTRFLWFALSVFALNVLLVGLTGPYPGARRAMWSLPLLYLACVHGSLLLAGGSPRLASTVKAALLVSLACLGARDWTIATRHFPHNRPDSFYPAVVAFLSQHAPLAQEAVLFENRERDAFRSRQYWCALTFTRSLWGEGVAPTLLRKGTPHPNRLQQDYWVLMQRGDTIGDVFAAFGPRSQRFVHPPDLPGRQRFVVPNPSPLRVLRVRPR